LLFRDAWTVEERMLAERTGMAKLIEISNLLIRRNGRDVLKIAALGLEHGETLAVVGPNGAGKITFLLALARLLRQARG
jgi:ABC-type Mn2+/Zn2+ transport system ATPase subunit